MKTHLLRIILFLCFLASSSFKIQAQTQRLAYAEAEATLTSSAPIHSSVVAPCDMAGRLVQQVTAAQYCDFLNHVATEDLHHLYDEKMATDPQAACIVRVGAPGGYRYKVIAGRGDFPISYVTWLDEARYCNWLEASVASEAGRSEITDDTLQEDSTKRGVYDLSGIDDGVTDDHFSPDLFVSKNLKATCWIFHDEEGLSNSLTSIARGNSYFEMATLSTPSLTLAAATASTASSNSTFNSYIKDVSGVAVIMGLAAFGSIGMVEESSVVGAATREQSSLTLADFRAAATTHPTASRLVIHEDGTIQPREANPDTAGRNRSENLTIHQALRDALTHEYPRRAAELFSSNAKIIDNPSHLSGEALRNIFININNLHNINETKDSNMELVFTNLKVAWSDLMAKADAFTKKRIDLWEVCTAARVVQNSAAQLKQRNRNIKAIEEIAWKIENLSHSITETAFWASDTKDAITVKTAIVHQQEGDVISAVCQLEDSAAKPIVMNVATGLASIVHMNLNISLSAEDLIIQHLISDAKWAVSNVAKGIASKDSQASHAVWSSEFDWAKQVIDEGTQLIEFLSKLIDQKSTESEAVIKISSLESSAHQDFLSEKVEAKSPKAETPQEALFLKTEWKKLDPKQRKVEASIFQKKAARAENSAIDAYIQLLDAYDESNSYEKMSSLANDAYQKAVKAKEAWRKLANAHRIGFELSSDDLNNKDWWGSKFESSKNNEAVWGDALESYQFDYQGNPELKEHGDSLISKRELKEFFYATLINFKETQGPEISQKIRIRILKTMMPNPYVRAEETVNAAGNVLDRQEMIATHLLVRLKEEENPEEFLEKLKKKLLEPLQSLNLSLDSATTLEAMLNKSLFIKRTTPYTPLYELNFRSLYEKNLQNFGLFEEILKVSKSLAVNSEPDYLLEVCTFLDGDSANAVPNDPNYALQWNLDAINGINAPAAWQIIGSPGLFETLGEEKPLIAIIDSGAYQEHQDLQDISCVEGINTVDSDNDTQDNHGHGTHITGIIGAGLNNRLGIAGIVPSVRMMLCKIYGVSRRDSRPSVRSITSAVYYACNHGAKILNCSFYLYHFPELLNAFQYAHEKGIIVVAAAGNEGADNDMNPRFPANYGIDHGLDNVISVAATKENGELWYH
ncbi:MAG: S8 family serine peptidase, partial [Chthoniobacterales bacterium]